MKGLTALALVSVLAIAAPALAGEARTYFDIGAKAYEAGRYMDAISAFKEAYRLSKRPGLLFSLGQANRMEFFARSDPARLKDAVHYYEQYVAKVPSGHHRRDATEALATLKPMLANVGGEAAGTAGAGALVGGARVMISSPTDGARITFDGKPVSDPFMQAVQPGKHKVRIAAKGYQPYERDLVVDAKTGAPPLDITLEEKPARLVVRAPSGAEVSVDGRPEGVAPLPALSLPSGEHFVAVTENGHKPFSRTVRLERGQSQTVEADLHVTAQRTTSWVLIGVGAAGLVTGGALGYVALHKQSQAQSIAEADTSQGNLPPGELGRYNALRQQRDDFRLGSVVALGAGTAVAGLGLVLLAFDEPTAPLPPTERGVPGKERAPETPEFEISAAPLLRSGLYGASVQGSF